MEILYLCAEVAPFSKVGGLADVSGSLPSAITEIADSQFIVLSPLYRTVDRTRFPLQSIGIADSLSIAGQLKNYEIFEYRPEEVSEPDPKVRYWFMDNRDYFDRPGIYTRDNGQGYDDNIERYLFFQRVALELIIHEKIMVDMVHVNDHHTTLLPWFIRNRDLDISTLLTLHNVQYQGQFSNSDLAYLDRIDRQELDPHRESFNSLVLGLHAADAVNTVSPTYARELQTNPDLAFGLQPEFQTITRKFSGILNGADDNIWNPASDPLLLANYSIRALGGKRKNKEALIAQCGFPTEALEKPLIGSVSRMVDTKGFDLILDILPMVVEELNVRTVFLGSGDPTYMNALRKLAQQYPRHIFYSQAFDEPLAHLIEAGTDLFWMPSKYEPCGLNQLYSMRYGTIPIVHRTGGLADSVTPWDGKRGTGFVFEPYTADAFLNSVYEAIQIFSKPDHWIQLLHNAMLEDTTWKASARKYWQLYQRIVKPGEKET